MKLETSHKTVKSSLRKQIRQRRQSLDANARALMDSAIHRGLATLIEQRQPSTVAAFWPFDGEPDLRPAMDSMERSGIRLALPVLFESDGASLMNFRPWHSKTRMLNNRFGIPEPDEGEVIEPQQIDLVLMPLVGWDPFGTRLGMGAGYYDRALQPCAQSNRPFRVGVAYQVQKVARLPAEPWDIRLHGVLSESGWFECRPFLTS